MPHSPITGGMIRLKFRQIKPGGSAISHAATCGERLPPRPRLIQVNARFSRCTHSLLSDYLQKGGSDGG